LFQKNNHLSKASYYLVGFTICFLVFTMSERFLIDVILPDMHKCDTQLLCNTIVIIFGILFIILSWRLYRIQLLKLTQALKANEDELRLIIEHSQDIIIRINKNGKFDYISQSAKNITGRAPEEAVGRSIFEFVHPDDVDKNIAAYKKLLETQSHSHYEFRYRHADGHYLWLETTGNVFLDEHNQVAGAILVAREITGRKLAEEKLHTAHQQLMDVIEFLPDATFVIDMEKKVIAWNRAIEELTGVRKEEILGKSDYAYALPFYGKPRPILIDLTLDENLLMESKYKYIKRKGNVLYGEAITRAAYGSKKAYLWGAASPLYDSKGNIMGAIESIRDITELKNIEKALKNSEEKFRTLVDDVLDSSAVGILILNREFKVVWLNRALENFFKLRREEILGISVRDLINERVKHLFIHPETFAKKLLNTYDNNTYVESFECHVSPSEEHQERWLEHYSQPIYSGLYAGGRIEHYYDITKRKQIEKQYKYLSMHDSLTGLHNRAYFNEEMQRMEGGRYLPLGIIVCDVDGLKLVNDTMGHEAGNNLLQAAANLLRNCFRKSDMVARIGGDEFVVLLPNTDRSTVENACNRLRDTITNYNQEQPEIPLSISIGFAISDDITKSPTNLFKEADLNMYREKLSHAQSTRSIIVQALNKVLEARDFATEGHAERMQELVANLAIACGVPEHKLNDLRLFALFHDLGKVGIPDQILFKPGSLTDEEFNQIKQHCEIGYRIANSVPDLKPIADWILKHHEWFNGNGYPLRLAGEDIPFECRILAIVDAYDAMTSNRPYRKAMAHEEAVAELIRCSGEQFDPLLVRKFMTTLPLCREFTEQTNHIT